MMRNTERWSEFKNLLCVSQETCFCLELLSQLQACALTATVNMNMYSLTLEDFHDAVMRRRETLDNDTPAPYRRVIWRVERANQR